MPILLEDSAQGVEIFPKRFKNIEFNESARPIDSICEIIRIRFCFVFTLEQSNDTIEQIKTSDPPTDPNVREKHEQKTQSLCSGSDDRQCWLRESGVRCGI